MKIAFDLDGVVVGTDLAMLRLINLTKDVRLKRDLMQYYCFYRPMQLNPLDFLAPDDELFFITGRDKLYEATTKVWAEKYFPMATLIVTDVDEPKHDDNLQDWHTAIARGKAEVIKKHSIDIYFDDNPSVVQQLRELCPDTLIILYGGRVDYPSR